MEIKTDAAVLIELIEDVAVKQPANPHIVAYQGLQRYNEEIGGDFDIIKIVVESCDRMRTHIDLLPRLKPNNRSSFYQAAGTVRAAFSLGNMGTRWDLFLDNLSQPVHIQALNFFDHLVSAQDFWEHRKIDPIDAEALISELENFIKESNFPEYGRRLILNELVKMRFILANIQNFGEQDYWEKFERVTGVFGSLYETLAPEKTKEAQSILSKFVAKINQAVSSASNITTIAQGVWPLLK